jgi:hypothetical protein
MLFVRGGDLRGDEEEASRQEGCPEEKEVRRRTKIELRWGRHPPAALILYFISLGNVKDSFQLFIAVCFQIVRMLM